MGSLLIVLVGCSTRLTDFTVISSKNVDLSRMDEYQRENHISSPMLVKRWLRGETGKAKTMKALEIVEG